jgi:hypothetical protein
MKPSIKTLVALGALACLGALTLDAQTNQTVVAATNTVVSTSSPPFSWHGFCRHLDSRIIPIVGILAILTASKDKWTARLRPESPPP